MNLQILSAGNGRFWVPSLLVAAMLIGCRTASVDWDKRVGVYSWDDAVTEMGPPDRVANLEGGVKAAEWIKSRGASRPLGAPAPSSTRSESLEGYQTYGSKAPDRVLRLSFTPDGKLLDWNSNY